MDKTRAAIQQALEALDTAYGLAESDWVEQKYSKAITALREVLEQPDWEAISKEQLRRYEEKFGALPQPVSQEPKRQEPTQEQYLALAKDADILVAHEHCHLDEREMKKAWVVEYGKLVYAKAWLDGFESAQPVKPVSQELVGHVLSDGTICWDRWCPDAGTLLYTTPVRTKELTDDEIAKACGWEFGQPMYEWVIGLARAVIAAYKEKQK